MNTMVQKGNYVQCSCDDQSYKKRKGNGYIKSLRQKFVFSSAPIFQSGSSTDEETKTSILAEHGAFATLIAKTAQK